MEKLVGLNSSDRNAAETPAYSFLPGFIGPLLEGVMYLLILGLGMMVLKYLEIGFVAELSWWWVLAPFALAVAWWAWADASGYTKRKAMEKMDLKKKNRLEKQRESLGIKPRRR
jgi:small Trp-rich protein